MIFSNFDVKHESYKERNFYYKVFAGYLFNEFLSDYAENKARFFDLLKTNIGSEKCFGNGKDNESLSEFINQLEGDELQVSFDYHTFQDKNGATDRGEMSDIVIWGKDYFISIEVKYLTDWHFEKDILSVQKRMKKIDNKEGIQVLLLKEEKWKNNQTNTKQEGSNLKKLEKADFLSFPLIIITWEQISEIIKNQVVKDFISEQLIRKL